MRTANVARARCRWSSPDVTRLLGGAGIDNTQDSRCGSKGNQLDRSQCFVDTSAV